MDVATGLHGRKLTLTPPLSEDVAAASKKPFLSVEQHFAAVPASYDHIVKTNPETRIVPTYNRNIVHQGPHRLVPLFRRDLYRHPGLIPPLLE